MEIFHNDWAQYINAELKEPYYQQLRQFLINEYKTQQIFPDMYDIFNALHYTSYHDTKVVILGQDPYHGAGPGQDEVFRGPLSADAGTAAAVPGDRGDLPPL